MQTISERVLYIIDQMGISQSEFSRMTGIATTTISDWRKKGTNPAADKIMPICLALSVSPEWLLSGIEANSDYHRRRDTDYVFVSRESNEYKLIESYSKLDEETKKSIMKYVENSANEKI